MFEVKTVERHSDAEPQHMKKTFCRVWCAPGCPFCCFTCCPAIRCIFPNWRAKRVLNQLRVRNGGIDHRNMRRGEGARRIRRDGTEHIIRSRLTVPHTCCGLKRDCLSCCSGQVACGIGWEDLVWGRDRKVHIRSEDRGASQPCGAAELELQFAGSGARWPLLLVDARVAQYFDVSPRTGERQES